MRAPCKHSPDFVVLQRLALGSVVPSAYCNRVVWVARDGGTVIAKATLTVDERPDDPSQCTPLSFLLEIKSNFQSAVKTEWFF